MRLNSMFSFCLIMFFMISTIMIPFSPALIHATGVKEKKEVTKENRIRKESRVRAKIGIQIKSREKITRARSRERLRAGDLIRLYVHSEKGCYIYIIHTDGKSVNLLNITEQKIQSSTLILPSAQAFYEIDGKSPMEKFTIICTPEKLSDLSDMEKRAISYANWSIMEAGLAQKSNLLISDEEHQPFAIAGNVRGGSGGGSSNADSFIRELQIFSGNDLLIKTYEFKIKTKIKTKK